MSKDKGVTASRSGCSPTASDLRSSQRSIPDAGWESQTVATWEVWRWGDYVITKANFYGPWALRHRGSLLGSFHYLQSAMRTAKEHAQAGEAGTAETAQTGSVHEHAVGETDATKTSDQTPHKENPNER